MNIDAIIGKIKEDAAQAARQALSTARERTIQMQSSAAEAIDRAKEVALQGAQSEAAHQRDRMLRMAALEERKSSLGMRREVIDAAFARALQTMRQMKPDQAKGFYRLLLLDVARGDEQLIVSDQDAAMFDDAFFAQVNEDMLKAGKQGKLSLSKERRALDGGFVLERRGMEINCSYESVLHTRRAELEAEVAAALFA